MFGFNAAKMNLMPPPSQALPSKPVNTGLAGGASGVMSTISPSRFLPQISTVGFVFVASVAAGAGLLIRDAFAHQSWLHAIQDGFVSAGAEIKTFFVDTVPALSSTAAIASYLGVGAFLASVVNLRVFAQGLLFPQQTFGQHAGNGFKTIVSGAIAGAGWGAMAGTLGAGAGALPGALLGASIGAGIGLAQALLMWLNARAR